MIWILLWALGVIGFFVYFFRAVGLRWFFLFLLAVVGMIGGLFLQGDLEKHAGYTQFVRGAARFGWPVLITGITVMIGCFIPASIYTIRQGKKDEVEGKTINTGPMTMGLSIPYGRSRRKMLLSRHDYITVESLLDGTATRGERLMVLGITLMEVAFFCIWAGMTLLLVEHMLIFVVFLIPGTCVLSYYTYEVWTAYRAAKRKLGRRRAGAAKDSANG